MGGRLIHGIDLYIGKYGNFNLVQLHYCLMPQLSFPHHLFYKSIILSFLFSLLHNDYHKYY